ncbi:MAG: hypothetical protein ACK52I_27520 [Pseudomonadota bacterium]|jgi:hypothetical protein
MASVSDLYAAAGRAGLLTPAMIGSVEVLVDFRAPDVEVLDGLGLSSDYAIRYPADEVLLDTGHELVIGGITYRVREVRAIGDGSECRATLLRI